MNRYSVFLFDFLDRFIEELTHLYDWKSSASFNKETFDNLSKDFSKLLPKHEESAKSFFTFDQKRIQNEYRPQDQDLNKNYEFIFSGCSQTHGDHITKPLVPEGDYNAIWGFQVANKYNKQGLNLGMGGWSAQSILKGLMNHFQQNGHPKVLLVLYPDFGRVEAVDSDKIKMPEQLNFNDIVQHWYLNSIDDKRFQRVSKSPYDPVNVLPWTFSLYHNLQSILLLQQYCNTNNIYFKYSSWDYNANILLKLLKNNFSEYSNYCEPTTLDFLPSTFFTQDCHLDIQDQFSKNIWNAGIDKEHMGIHQHIHIAERFIEELDNDNPWG